MITYDILTSPLGDITAAASDNAIIAVHISGDRYFTSAPLDWVQANDNPLLNQLQTEMDDFFAGKRTGFSVPIVFKGTEFQQLVWNALQTIPAGTTTTYGALAEKIGKPKAVRAVGTAIGKNPICIVVPCHRVMAGDGSLGGYVAGLERKRHLLTLEGAVA
jgi:methylated-DNA-[protein]-cysteine S-methyltransferase